MSENLKAAIAQLSEDRHVSCIGLICEQEDRVQSYITGRGGDPLADRPFPIGCIADFLISLVAFRLAEIGFVGLETEIERVLPEMESVKAKGPFGPVRLKDLLTRTSGLQDPRTRTELAPRATWAEIAPRIAVAPRLFRPGFMFSYGGIDLEILRETIRRVTGEDTVDLIKKLVLEPLGIYVGDRARRVSDEQSEGSPWSFYLSELAAIAANLSGRSRGPALLSPKSYQLLSEVNAGARYPSQPSTHGRTGFTHGASVYADGLVGVNGEELGRACAIRFDRQSKSSMAVAVEGPPRVRDEVVALAADHCGWSRKVHPATHQIGSFVGISPALLAGTYAGCAVPYGIKVTTYGDLLECEFYIEGHLASRHSARMVEQRLEYVEGKHIAWMEFVLDPVTGAVGLLRAALPYCKVV